jgi:hypothetical protein
MAANLSNPSAPSGAPIRESPQIADSTTRLTLVRHAPSDATRRSAFPLDEHLDARGLDEARALAARLGRFDAAWTSPAARARETAQALGLNATAAAELDECDFGAWRGRTLAELDDDDPVAVAAWIEDPAAAPHGGESLLALLARVRSWLETRAGAWSPSPTPARSAPRSWRRSTPHRTRSGASTSRPCRARCSTRTTGGGRCGP